ncbi:DUF3417 domain-containing protein [Candidatus Omnitrophota bacterium]
MIKKIISLIVVYVFLIAGTGYPAVFSNGKLRPAMEFGRSTDDGLETITREFDKLLKHWKKVARLLEESPFSNVMPIYKNLYEFSTRPWFKYSTKLKKLFNMIDKDLWREYKDKPHLFIEKVSMEKWKYITRDDDFIKLYKEAVKSYASYTGSGKIAQGIDPAAELFFKAGQNKHEPMWLKLRITANVLLRHGSSQTPDDIREEVENTLKAHNLIHKDAVIKTEEVEYFLEQLASVRLIGKRVEKLTDLDRQMGLYSIETRTAYIVNNESRLAIWANDWEYIGNEIKEVIENKEELKARLLEYESICEQLWPNYFVEDFNAVMFAAAGLDPDMQKILLEKISDFETDDPADFYNHRIFDDIRLTLLPSSGISSDWLKHYASNLIGKTLVIVSPEISYHKGGLAHVLNDETIAMLRFAKTHGLSVVWVEPYYKDSEGDRERVKEFEVMYKGIPIATEIYKCNKVFNIPNEEGEIETFEIPTYQIRDKGHKLIHTIYKYKEPGKDGPDRPVTLFEFSNFFPQSVVEALNLMLNEGNGDWKNPVILPQDGQCLSFSFWRRWMYAFNKSTYKLLKSVPVIGRTHTYKNRGRIWFDSLEDAHKFLDKQLHGLSRAYHHYWIGKDVNGQGQPKYVVDLSSSGLRTSEAVTGVARIHVFEMNPLDPRNIEKSVTNGDELGRTAELFNKTARALYKDLISKTIDYLAPDRIKRIKKERKRSLVRILEKKTEGVHGYMKINTDEITLTAALRGVPEKLPMGPEISDKYNMDIKMAPAWTPGNIREWVKQGVQIVIFGNRQEYGDSEHICDELKALAEEIKLDKETNKENSSYAKGTFIFVDKFTPGEKRALLSAADIQMLISAREKTKGTEAAGLSETNSAGNYSITIGPVWIEGILNSAPLINFDKPGMGGTVTPYADTEGAYFNTVMRLVKQYKENYEDFAKNQQAARVLNQTMKIARTGAAYLRFYNDVVMDKETFDIELEYRNPVLTKAGVELNGIYVGKLSPELDEDNISKGIVTVEAELFLSPGVQPPEVAVNTNVDADPKKDNWEEHVLKLDSFDGHRAVYSLEIKAHPDRKNAALTWRLGPGGWLADVYSDAKIIIEQSISTTAQTIKEINIDL